MPIHEIVVLQLEKTLIIFTLVTDYLFLLRFAIPRGTATSFSFSQYCQRTNGAFAADSAPLYAKKTEKVLGRFRLALTLLRASKVREPRSKKEVFQPHLPVRLPCYDLAPVTCFALGRSSRSRTSGAPDFHGLTGGVYKARERIHRAMADARLLANPASRSRVADSDPN